MQITMMTFVFLLLLLLMLLLISSAKITRVGYQRDKKRIIGLISIAVVVVTINHYIFNNKDDHQKDEECIRRGNAENNEGIIVHR